MKHPRRTSEFLRKIFKHEWTRRERAESDSSESPSVQSEATMSTLDSSSQFGIAEWVPCDDAVVDICFIHGLSGKRHSTWTAKGQSQPWPKQLLRTALPSTKVRILTYGYDAHIIRTDGAVSGSQITDHANTFLQKLTADREMHLASHRPLIVVAHSLGGIVCKQALLKSRQSAEPHLRSMYDTIRGIIFMGTPHAGSPIADWGKILAQVVLSTQSANVDLIRVLQTDNEMLRSIDEDFGALVRNMRENPARKDSFFVKCFYEELEHPKYGIIVPKESATFRSDPSLGIRANHANMVKFATADDEGFRSVAAELWRFASGLKQVPRQAFEDAQKQATENAHVQATKDSRMQKAPEHASTSYVPEKTLGGDVFQLVGLPLNKQAWDAFHLCLDSLGFGSVIDQAIDSIDEGEMVKQKQKITDVYTEFSARYLRSVSFESMMVREDTIARPEKDTCRWIYEDPLYKPWVANSKALLWIKGKPGSGKSILMKSIFKQRQMDLRGTSTILLRFFFNARGSAIERSPEALYRTLVYELMKASPAFLCKTLPVFIEKESRGNTFKWQVTELADIFHSEIEDFHGHDVEILIDALDECDDHEVLQVIRRFEKSIQVPRDGTSLRVCWSSRFYPNIGLATHHGIELILNQKNAADIRRYIGRSFWAYKDESIQTLGEEIIERANGTFLWAFLVADRLITAFNAGTETGQLREMLHRIPDGLDNLFLEIFTRPELSAVQRSDLRRFFLLVLVAKRPLTMEELYSAMFLDDDCGEDWHFQDLELQGSKLLQFEKRLTHGTGGLLEVVYRQHSTTSRESIVQVIHESVRDFLHGKGIALLQETSEEMLWVNGHYEMLRVSLKCLANFEQVSTNIGKDQTREPIGPIDDVLTSLIPSTQLDVPRSSFLASYAYEYAFSHLNDYETYRAYYNLLFMFMLDEPHHESPVSLHNLHSRQYALLGYIRLVTYGYGTSPLNQLYRVKISSNHSSTMEEMLSQAAIDTWRQLEYFGLSASEFAYLFAFPICLSALFKPKLLFDRNKSEDGDDVPADARPSPSLSVSDSQRRQRVFRAFEHTRECHMHEDSHSELFRRTHHFLAVVTVQLRGVVWDEVFHDQLVAQLHQEAAAHGLGGFLVGPDGSLYDRISIGIALQAPSDVSTDTLLSRGMVLPYNLKHWRVISNPTPHDSPDSKGPLIYKLKDPAKGHSKDTVVMEIYDLN